MVNTPLKPVLARDLLRHRPGLARRAAAPQRLSSAHRGGIVSARWYGRSARLAATVRLLEEIHRAADADVGSRRVWLLLGWIGTTAAIAASDLMTGASAARLHELADRLAERVAELEGGDAPGA